MLNRGEPLALNDLDEQLIYDNFQDFDLNGFFVKLCGVLGDPLIHPKMLEISRWFVERGAIVQISTNAGLRGPAFWRELGEISKQSERLEVNFAIDGLEDTNHVYRVNTSYEAIAKNVRAYTEAGGRGHWIFIEFDHNAHQKETARALAESLGLGFLVRRAAKNSVFDWKVKADEGPKKRVSGDYTVVKREGRAHSETATYKNILENRVAEYDPSTVNCKWVHGDEFFLASNGTVWPCCYFWDEYNIASSSFRADMNERHGGLGWNDLNTQRFGRIFEHGFYTSLQDLWKSENPHFMKRCYLSCGNKGKMRNSFSKD